MTTTPNDFDAEAEEVRRFLRLLPRSLQSEIRRLRRSYHRGQILDLLRTEIEKVAAEEYAHVRVRRVGDPDYTFIPADRYEDIFKRVVEQPGLKRRIRNATKKLLRFENVQKEVFPEPGLRLDERLPDQGPLSVHGSTRFNRVEALFETVPVGVVAAVVNRIVQQIQDPLEEEIGFSEDPEQDFFILSWHCGLAGLPAIVLDYKKPFGHRFNVVEVDVFNELRDREYSTSWSGNHEDPTDPEGQKSPVLARLYEMPPGVTYDFVILDMPPPGEEAAAQLRNTYKTQGERRLLDPGRQGPRRWRGILQGYVERLPQLLNDDGEAILILPESIREDRGYRACPGLLQGLRDVAHQVGLHVERDVEVVEADPLPQPFVGRSRPQRRIVVLRRPS